MGLVFAVSGFFAVKWDRGLALATESHEEGLTTKHTEYTKLEKRNQGGFNTEDTEGTEDGREEGFFNRKERKERKVSCVRSSGLSL